LSIDCRPLSMCSVVMPQPNALRSRMIGM
jgi:hypothetical protein